MSVPIWYLGDRDPSITENITAGGSAVDLSSASVLFKMRPVNGSAETVSGTAVVVAPATGGNVRYDWTAADVTAITSAMGAAPSFPFLVRWEVTRSGKVQTVFEALAEWRQPEPGSPLSYVTLEQLKNTLSLSGETFGDLDVEIAAAAASRAVEELCGRRFYADANANQVRHYSPDSALELEIDDLVTLTSLKADEDGSGSFEVTWAATDYVLEPLNAAADSWPYSLIRVHPNGARLFPTAYPKSVELTGKFGWPAIPKPVEQATTILAAKLFRRAREAPFGILSAGLETGGAIRIARTDPDVSALCFPFARHRLAVA